VFFNKFLECPGGSYFFALILYEPDAARILLQISLEILHPGEWVANSETAEPIGKTWVQLGSNLGPIAAENHAFRSTTNLNESTT
jgi:hypothetical protein